MTKVKQLPARSEVKKSDCWNLSSLFESDDAWEAAFMKWEKQIGGYAQFQGTLAADVKNLAACLKFDEDLDRRGERLGTYAFLKTAEDSANSAYQRMQGRFINAVSRAGQEASFIRPEILAIPQAKMKTYLADRRIAPYRLSLERLIRYRPHTLSRKEEKLLAMQTEMAQTAGHSFHQLNDADLRFGAIRDERSELVELSHATFSTMLHCPKRSVRKTAFHQYYKQFAAHENTLAAMLGGSVQRDIYYARARNHASSLSAALFPDQVPESVYANLIGSVRRHLPALHRYYDVRRRKMRLKDIHMYDTYVPILGGLQTRRTWDEAVRLVLAALEPLGGDYLATLEKGLDGGWCDRYENRGKQSGAFSAGSYDGWPYILMNYQPDVLDHVFTLAHEAGHSMHSHYSAARQPYTYYNYVIFVAEVASTLNEELLAKHLMAQAKSDEQRAFLINRQIDACRGTIFRQTMFAEFEKTAHEMAEQNEPLTVEAFKSIYRELLEAYFGPDFALDDELSLECFRIPHFYRAFYVYKYATGMSAAMALADRITSGGKRELDAYLGFLGGGCSKDPLDLLRDAGVDMERPEPVDAAMTRFGQLVEKLDRLI